jgi:hypothetical protein
MGKCGSKMGGGRQWDRGRGADLGDGARAIRDGQSGGLGDGVGLATMGQHGSLWTVGGEGRDGLNDGRVACSHGTGGQSQKSH